ncbi:MAG: 6-phosphogluconolactonase [Chloroflexota bacterium]
MAPDLQRLSEAAAGLFVELAGDAVDRRGRFAVALSGGSTPRRLYQLLAGAPWRQRVDWGCCHFFWGDERLVPPDHPDSNYRLARETLLDGLPLSPDQIHRVPVELGEPETVAAAYEEELRRFFGRGPAAGDKPLSYTLEEFPRFDLVLLGLGTDGHTASLFPGQVALEQRDRWAVATPPGRLPPPVDRITLTLPVLNAARIVVFLVAGADKTSVLREILEGESCLPAARVRPTQGELRWFVDR